VKGDQTKTFNVATTDRKTIWVPVENAAPVFYAPSLKILDSNFFKSSESNTSNPGSPDNTPLETNQTLVKVQELFQDTPDDQLEWELDIPKNLKGLVELDKKTGAVKLSESVKDLKDLPTGSHRLTVRAKDSSGLLGDSSGIRSGSIRLLVTPPEDASKAVKGLSHLTSLNVTGMSDLFAKPPEQLDDKEKEAITILEKLNITEKDSEAFAEKLEEGSIAVLSNSDTDKPMLLIDTSMSSIGEGDDELKPILTDAMVEDVTNEQVTASSSLLPTKEIVDTPIGEIDFTVDSRGKDFSVVQLKMENGGINMDTLFKTTSDGTPFVFKSEILSYSEDDGPLDEWLNNLNYGLYYYDPDNTNSILDKPLVSLKMNDSGLAEILSKVPAFDLDKQLNKIDGSGYLIDLDNNNTIDLISMLIVDEGWFDTKQGVLGLIGDPLIPASTTTVERVNSSGGGGTSRSGDGGFDDKSTADEIGTNPDDDDLNAPEGINQPNDVDVDTPSETNLPDVSDDVNSDSPNKKISNDSSVSFESDMAQSNTSTANALPNRSFNRDQNKNRNNILTAPGISEFERRNLQNGTSIAANATQNSRFDAPALNTKERTSNRTGGQSESELRKISDDAPSNLLETVQNLMSSARQETSDALRSIISPLRQDPETSIAAALGMIALPLITERSATRVLKAANKDINLKLSRRDPLFNGCWITYNRKGEIIVIERKNGKLLLKPFNPELHKPLKLKGSNSAGNSLLSQSLSLCKKPGAFIRSLQTLQMELTHTQTTDLNWNTWFDHHFKHDKASRSSNKESSVALDQLRSLIEKATEHEVAFADILMLRQLIDCKEMLGLEIKINQERRSTKKKLSNTNISERKNFLTTDSRDKTMV
jgi:hypothetical protein